MFTKNAFIQKDPITEAIAKIAEADYKAKMEELKGQQHKIDKNKNNKIDADDFKILRGEKSSMKKEEAEQIDEEINVKKDYDDHEQSEHGVYKGKRKIGYIVHDKKAGTHTAYHGHKYGKDDYENSDNFSSHEAAVKRIKSSAGIEESNNPFDVKNYKSQLKSKPGEKAGFDSKKISTGTVYSRKPVKDEPMKKEEIDPNNTTTDTLKGREKTSDNPFLSKKVKMDVPDNVKEEAEQIDELKTSTLLRYQTKANKALIGGDRNKEEKRIKGIQTANYKIQNRYKVKEEVEQIDELSPGLLDRASKKAAANAKSARAKGHVEAGDEHMGQAVRLRSGYHDAVERDRKKASMSSMSPAKQRKYAISQKRAMGEEYAYEEVQHIDERELTKGETAEKERIVKGMKKSLKGFKARYGERAKEVMYATATKAAKKD